MNFEIIDEKSFRVNGNTFRRLYKIKERFNGNLRLYNAKDGSILFDDLDISNVQVSGNPATIKELENVIFFPDCKAGPSRKFRLFSRVFSKKFN